MMRCALIGSGSAGNALLVTAGDTRLLVDCGYSIKTFEARAAVLDFDPASLDAILVTHEHEDHLGGVLPLARKYALPVYWSRGTSLAASAKPGVRPVTHEFSPHASFAIGDIDILPVPVPHDAREPTQFVFRHGGVQVGMLTDLGSLTPHVLAAYAACNALILEFNHDPTLLAESAYPATLKARVASAYGHLSNAQSVGFLAQLDTSRLQRLVAAHLSERTNRPTLVAACLAQSVPGVVVEIARQDAVLPWFEV
jgi:phosphoribosyl 1,2-cyclic phosphodiesterase